MNYLLVGFGGFLGALARFYLGRYITVKSNTDFPLGTFIINITGAFILSLLTFNHSLTLIGAYSEINSFVMVGFLGAYTTFSTLSYETLQLIRNKDYYNLSLYVGGTLLLGLVALYLGMMIGKII